MPRWALVIAVGLVVYLQYRLWIGPGGYADVVDLSARAQTARDTNSQLSQRNAQIEAQIVRLETDPAAIEYHARADLGMIRPGESFYLVVH